jgi:hypothetical protein
MTEFASSPGLNHDRPNLVTRRHLESAYTSKAKLNFGFREANSHQALYSVANTNPFVALEAVNPEAEDAKDNQEDLRESWTIQGRKKHTPRITSPRPALPQSPTPTPNHEVTPRGRRKRMHSEVHRSYFTSLSISVPPGQKHARTRIWLVLSREKNDQKEILVYARNNSLPSLPLKIKITGSSEEEWTHASALVDITQSTESELEDKVLRYSLNLKDRVSLEWSWQEEQTKGGWECTILTHISTSTSAISVNNKRHLHWRMCDSLTSMNNDIEFSGPAHSLLLKSGPVSTDRQVCKSASASLLASPQAIRKKRFIKLDLSKLEPLCTVTPFSSVDDQEAQGAGQEEAGQTACTNMGSISSPAAQNPHTHVWKNPHPGVP